MGGLERKLSQFWKKLTSSGLGTMGIERTGYQIPIAFIHSRRS